VARYAKYKLFSPRPQRAIKRRRLTDFATHEVNTRLPFEQVAQSAAHK